jgi:hypothetical protein
VYFFICTLYYSCRPSARARNVEFLENPVMLPVKEMMDEFDDIRSLHVLSGMDRGCCAPQKTASWLGVIVHERATIGGRTDMQDWSLRIREADACRAGLSPLMFEL